MSAFLSEQPRRMIPSLHPYYDDRSSEIIRDLRNMKADLIRQIEELNCRLHAVEAFIKDRPNE